MTLFFAHNLDFVWGSTVVTGGGTQTRISFRLIVQDGSELEEIFL